MAGLVGVDIAEDDAGRALSVLLAIALEVARAFGLTISHALAVAMSRPQVVERATPNITVAEEPARDRALDHPPALAARDSARMQVSRTRASEIDAAIIDYGRRAGRVRETQRVTADKLGLPKSSVGASLLRLRERGVLLQQADGGLELAVIRAVA